MRELKGAWIFYKKLIFPALLFSLLIGLIGMPLLASFSLKGVGLAYAFLAPLFHYLIYEVRNEKEYYFYHNLGLSRPNLWLITITISLIIGFVSIIV